MWSHCDMKIRIPHYLGLTHKIQRIQGHARQIQRGTGKEIAAQLVISKPQPLILSSGMVEFHGGRKQKGTNTCKRWCFPQRSGGDSNPRYCLTQYVHLANGCFQPLSHRSNCCVPPTIPAPRPFVNIFFCLDGTFLSFAYFSAK